MEATALAARLLDGLPANRTLGVRVVSAVDGAGVCELAVTEPVTNVIGALHSSGVAALVDAAALAAVLAALPSEAVALRAQALGLRARLQFLRPVRGTATGSCRLSDEAVGALTAMVQGGGPASCTTVTEVRAGGAEVLARGEFDWTVRLAPPG